MAKEKFENSELEAYYSKIYSDLEKQTQADPYGSYVFKRISGGQKTIFNKSQSEIRNFDMSFLDTIESVYPAILKIMRDPKKSIRYEEEIVNVEKAKKVNSQTVRHLSSHTQLIKEITKEGDVIPSKVLTTYAEEELAIYENRFIKSLVKRMEMFLEKRFEVMKVSLESFITERLNVSNEFLMSGQKVTMNLDIAIKNDLTTNVEATKEQFNRLCYVRELVQGLKGTEFMRALAKAREVLPPIMKTNIILHNPDFKLCYGLWLYLDRVDGISNDVEVKEKTYKYTPIFDKDINQAMTLALTSFIKNREIEGIHSSKNLGTIKAPKPQTNENIELELNLGADNKKLEDYTMNQLLLDQTANFFEASFDGMQRTGNTYNESIRVVYRQMLDMLDQIYPKAFGVSDEELDSKSLYEQLEYARRRKMVINIVRQQKQMNIARMGKEEKRIEKLLATLEKKIKDHEEKERIKAEKQRIKEEKQRAEALARAKELEEKRKKLEQRALEKQLLAEKKAAAKRVAEQAKAGMGEHQAIRARELGQKRRDRMRNLKLGIETEEVQQEEQKVVYLDSEGMQIDEDMPQEEKVQYVDENGNPVDEFGNPLDENGNPIEADVQYVDENGNPVDEFGNPLDENGNPIVDSSIEDEDAINSNEEVTETDTLDNEEDIEEPEAQEPSTDEESNASEDALSEEVAEETPIDNSNAEVENTEPEAEEPKKKKRISKKAKTEE